MGFSLNRGEVGVSGGGAVVVVGEAGDSEPDPFSFVSQSDVALNTLIESNVITPVGYNVQTYIEATNGEYRLDGGAWQTSGTIVPGQTLQVRHTSSSSVSTDTITIVVIGGVGSTFQSTTGLAQQTYNLPSSWDSFMTRMATELPNHIDNFTLGDSNILSSTDYNEAGSAAHSVFHSAFKIVLEYEAHLTRLGQPITHSLNGRRAALQIYMRRWQRQDATRRQTQADSVFYALNGVGNYNPVVDFNDSDTLLSGSLRTLDNQDQLDAILLPNFRSLGNFGARNNAEYVDIGSGNLFGGGYGTHRNRPAGFWAQAVLFWLKHNNASGTSGSVPYIDFQGVDPMPWIFQMLVTHIYRFRNGWFGSFTTTNYTASDSGFFDLFHITFTFFRIWIEYCEENGVDIDLYVPGTGPQAVNQYVMGGDYFENGQEDRDLRADVCPYTPSSGPMATAVENMLLDTYEFMCNPLDNDWNYSASPSNPIVGPNGNTYEYPFMTNLSDYFLESPQTTFNGPAPAQQPYYRVLVDNLARDDDLGIVEVNRYVGDPMVVKRSDTRCDWLGRTGSAIEGGQSSSNSRNIQLMLCTDFWFMALRMRAQGIETARVDRMMNYAELTFNGNDARGELGANASKARNQRYWHFFDGLNYLDELTGGQVYA